MKKFIYTICAIVIAQCSMAQSYTPTDAGSSVKFLIKNFGSTVNGSFTGLKGFVLYNPAKVTATIFNVTVDATTVNTGSSGRDKHLKKEDYFNVATFSTINFLSSKVSTTDVAGVFKVDGYVTIKGIKKVVSFPFKVMPSGTGFIFTGEFTINRRDFTVGGGSLVLADNLVVKLQVNSTKN
jgi:polyisoprenoid-binding protein YceI